MNFSNENNFNKYFSKNIKTLYIFATVAIIAGYTVDTLMFFDKFTTFVILINILIVFFTAIFFLLGLLNKMDIRKSYLAIVYLTFFGLFVAYYYDIIHHTLIVNLLVRNVIIFPMIIFSVGFIVSRKQMIIAGIVIALFFPTLLLASQIKELIEITPFITVIILISTITISFFISSMEKSIEENQRKEEELIEQKKKLEELNRDKDNLFSVISHDLRGPVGNAKQMVKYLMDNETSAEEKQFLLEAINSSIGNSFNLLNNLLQWARNERGVIELKKKNNLISKSIVETISLLQNSAEKKNITIDNKVDSKLISYCDKNLFETVIRNLLSNAIKFTHDGGKIEISCNLNSNYLIVSVKDNGGGISEKNKKEIFKNSNLISELGTNNERGSGLGLKLCKEFVEKNDGKIWFESEEGKGATFYFTVPKERAKDAM